MKSYDNGSQSDFEIISFESVSPHIFMSKTPDDVLHRMSHLLFVFEWPYVILNFL